MINLKPEFYNQFICSANNCRDTCCKGWDIQLDKQSVRVLNDFAVMYPRIVDKNISLRNDNYFINFKDGICPFLKNRLCIIQCLGGEKFLCYACRIYPRQKNVYENQFTKYSLFISCEEAAKAILRINNGETEFNLPYCSDNIVNVSAQKHNKIIDKIYRSNNIKEDIWDILQTDGMSNVPCFHNFSFTSFQITAVNIMKKMDFIDRQLFNIVTADKSESFNSGLNFTEFKNLSAYYIWHYFTGQNIAEVRVIAVYMLAVYDYFISKIDSNAISIVNKADIIHRISKEIEHCDYNMQIIKDFFTEGG